MLVLQHCERIMAATLLVLSIASMALAADVYTVWGAVIYTIPGESRIDGPNSPLTTLGLQQAYSQGQFFRSQYLTGSTSIRGINASILDVDQLYVQAYGSSGSVGVAQAFVQGLYPQVRVSDATASQLDPTSISADGTYLEAPLGGYQYPMISVAGLNDASFPFLGGSNQCPTLASYFNELSNLPSFQTAKNASVDDYSTVRRLLGNKSSTSWDYDHAYTAHRQLSYLRGHDAQVNALLQSNRQPGTNKSYVDVFHDYASQQQRFRLGNTSALNAYTQIAGFSTTKGSISTISGNMLATRILQQLTSNGFARGSSKLFTMFGGFETMISLLSLLGLNDATYLGLPEQSASLVFELYSYEPSSNSTIPTADRLRVAFKFRNGTATGTPYSSPSGFDWTWDAFQRTFNDLSFQGGIGDWCQQCGNSRLLFCMPFFEDASPPVNTVTQLRCAGRSPVEAGAIGAVVALAVATLIFALVMLLGRVRFHRKPRQTKLGGFKGSAKLASDADLATPAKGRPGAEGHERTGSWELRQKEQGYAPRASFDHADPFADSHAMPVQPREHV